MRYTMTKRLGVTLVAFVALLSAGCQTTPTPEDPCDRGGYFELGTMDTKRAYAFSLAEVLGWEREVSGGMPQTPEELVVNQRLDYLEGRCYARRAR